MRPLALAACVALTGTVGAQVRPAADRVLDGPLPVWNAQLTVDIALQIAKLAKVPLGIEALPRDPAARLLPVGERLQLGGATVGDALDRLVHLDSRYRWSEEQGVIVIRPAAAWADARHFMDEPLDAIVPGLDRMFRDAGFEPREGASLRDALNDAAREGTLVWEVGYGTRIREKTSLRLSRAEHPGGGSVELPLPFPAWLADVVSTRAAATGQAESPADRTIDGVLIHTHTVVDALVIDRIARYARVPVGFEALPDDAYRGAPTRLPIERQRVLTGLTVREALDWLVELDQRYYWVESRGVIVIRPMLAWGDSKHFLNTIVVPFAIEERDPADVMWALSRLVRTGKLEWPPIPAPVWVPLTMASTSPVGILEVLNDIARTASLRWVLQYAHQPGIGPTTTVRFSDIEGVRQVQSSMWLRIPWPRWLAQVTPP